jgi:hypothetical protein
VCCWHCQGKSTSDHHPDNPENDKITDSYIGKEQKRRPCLNFFDFHRWIDFCEQIVKPVGFGIVSGVDADGLFAIDPENREAYEGRGVALQYQEDKMGACEDWKKAVSLGSEKAKGYLAKYCL